MDDLTEVAVICELRERGFSLQRVRKLVRLLQRDFRKRLAQTVSGNSECHLLTDGTRLYLETSHLNIIDILTNSRQPLLSISISDTMRRIRAGIRVNKRASGSVRMGSRRSKSRAS
jgi:DNA-binding transcriptional MerR regulator